MLPSTAASHKMSLTYNYLDGLIIRNREAAGCGLAKVGMNNLIPFTLSTKKNATNPVTSSKMKIMVSDPINYKILKKS